MSNRWKLGIVMMCAGMLNSFGVKPSFAATDVPAVPNKVPNVAGFAAGGWKIESHADGDLNKDGRPDAAVILAFPDDGSPIVERVLVVAFRDPAGKLVKNKENKSAVALSGGTLTSSPKVSIKHGVLIIDHSHGGKETTNYEHKYQWREGNWVLIGYTENTHSAKSNYNHRSLDLNLLTGELASSLSSQKKSLSERFMEVRSPLIQTDQPTAADWTSPSVWLKTDVKDCPVISIRSVHNAKKLFIRVQYEGSKNMTKKDLRVVDTGGRPLVPESLNVTPYGYVIASYDLESQPLKRLVDATSKDETKGMVLRLNVEIKGTACNCTKPVTTASKNDPGAILLTALKSLPNLDDVNVREGHSVHPPLYDFPAN